MPSDKNILLSDFVQLQKQNFGSKRIHFIGIGGIGMSGIASILMKQGYRVSGSDTKESRITNKLISEGAKIFYGHNISNIDNADVVVYSSAIREDNVELLAAKNKGLTVIRRAEALVKLMQDKICIAISGSHGKTTTTALASHLLFQTGFNPTASIGGIVRNFGDNSCFGNSNIFIAEADESDGTFLYYKPNYTIVTNIDREHLDYYHSWQDILSAYEKFILNTKENGYIFCCGDDLTLRQITKEVDKKCVYFGLSKDNDFYADDIKLAEFSSEFSYYYKGKRLGSISLPLAGAHNISNSLAIVGLGCKLGISLKEIENALSLFSGTERRFQLKAEIGGIKIIDDYGHHPSEIKATLSAASNVRHKRLIVVFQPHRYSRTKFLMEEFSKSFALADYLILTDIYAASELPIDGVSSEALCKRIKNENPQIEAVYLKKEKIIEHILKIIKPKDLLLTLGAGDIGKLSDELVERLKRKDTV